MVQVHPAAFDAIAEQYDDLFTNSLIGRAQRDAVWDVLKSELVPGSAVLELNCGTGEDAVFLAKRGLNVFATDISEAMIQVARSRASQESEVKLQFVRVAIEDVATLSPGKSFDAVFSNFSGLNCVEDLRQVAGDVAKLLPAGSRAILCFSNKRCLWEVIWYLLHAQPRKAFRRWGSRPIAARLGNSQILVRYPTVRQIAAEFSPHFRVREVHGIGIAVPPSYLEPSMRRMPRVMALFRWIDRQVRSRAVLRALGDHVLVVMERTAS